MLTANMFWLFLLIISSFDRCATHTNEKWCLRVIQFIYKPRAGLTSLDCLVIKNKIPTTFSVDEICSSKKRLRHDVIWSHSVGTFRFCRVFSFKSSEFNKNRRIKDFLRYNPTSSNNHDDDSGKENFKKCSKFYNLFKHN